ncbi:24351_t:CDS:2, partial [Racocetra persica]
MSQFRRASSKGPLIVLTPEEKRVYGQLFQLADVDKKGVIEGQHAVKFFSTSGLSPSILSEIWQIADSENLGYLTQQSFSVSVKLIAQAIKLEMYSRNRNYPLTNSARFAMYFVQNAMNGSIKNLPSVLPDGFYDMASGTTANAPTFPTSPQPPSRKISGVVDAPISPITQDYSWDVTPDDKATYDKYFNSLDGISNKGYLTGDEAASFFMKSRLTPNVLAQIWDLADIRKSGSLNRDEFAVAMHLMVKKMNGAILPATLPPSLIPPSMRSIP